MYINKHHKEIPKVRNGQLKNKTQESLSPVNPDDHHTSISINFCTLGPSYVE